MLSLFFKTDVKAQALSRFSQKTQSKKITEIIEKLQSKENELKKSSETLGPDSLDYAKYDILSRLLSNINNSIGDFNNKPSSLDFICELRDFINLLRELAEHIKEVNQHREHKDTLSQFRNKDREHARTALTYGVWGAIGAAFTFSGLGLGASTFLVGSGVGSLVDNKTDVYSLLPQTCVLLNQLLQTTNLAIKNSILTMNLSQLIDYKVELSDEDNMICPISRKLIENPYICALDGYSYEKEKLEKWLYEHRASPITRKSMKPDASVEDTMIHNRQLKHINDNYKLYQYAATHKPPEDNSSMKLKQ